MGRLIDADLLYKIIVDGGFTTGNIFKDMELLGLVKQQPTAYDPEEVVKQLEEMKPDIECCDDEEDYQYYLKRHNKYIEIVRKGGVKNE